MKEILRVLNIMRLINGNSLQWVINDIIVGSNISWNYIKWYTLIIIADDSLKSSRNLVFLCCKILKSDFQDILNVFNI